MKSDRGKKSVIPIFNSINIHTRRTISQVFFFFYGDSVIKSCERIQQGDPESPPLFSDSIQHLIDSLESKINLWYLDDGIWSVDYRTILKDLKKLLERKERWDSKINPRNVIFFPW